MIAVISLYIVLSLIIGFLGANKKFGFWGYFFCSLALTPFIGVIVLLASDTRKKQQKKCPNCSFPLSD